MGSRQPKKSRWRDAPPCLRRLVRESMGSNKRCCLYVLVFSERNSCVCTSRLDTITLRLYHPCCLQSERAYIVSIIICCRFQVGVYMWTYRKMSKCFTSPHSLSRRHLMCRGLRSCCLLRLVELVLLCLWQFLVEAHDSFLPRPTFDGRVVTVRTDSSGRVARRKVEAHLRDRDIIWCH